MPTSSQPSCSIVDLTCEDIKTILADIPDDLTTRYDPRLPPPVHQSIPRMNPFDTTSTWGVFSAQLYDRVVAASQEELYRRLLREITAEVPAGEVLDVGCGPGHAAVLLAGGAQAARVTGLDSSPEMVRLAARRARRVGQSNVAFVQGDACALPFPEARFDLVFSIASIKHWVAPSRGLAEIARVLVPGGRAVILEADRGAPEAVILAHARRWRPLPPRVLAAYFRVFIAGQSLDPSDAAALLARSPFEEHRVERLADLPFFAIHARKR